MASEGAPDTSGAIPPSGPPAVGNAPLPAGLPPGSEPPPPPPGGGAYPPSPPPPPGEGYPPPAPAPPPGRRSPLLAVGAAAALLALVCCVCGLFGIFKGVGQVVRAAGSAIAPSPTPAPQTAGPTTEPRPGQGSPRPEETQSPPPLIGPQDAFNVKVGQCLGDDPTNAFPEQKTIVPCTTVDSRKVVARFDGTTDESLCSAVQGWYWEDFAGTSRDFIVCIE